MFSKTFLTLFSVLALVTMACSLTINLPVTTIKTGKTETQDISVPFPDSDATPDIELSFGAGELHINPGAESMLVEGTATYNVAEFKPEVEVHGTQVSISTGNITIKGIPNFKGEYKNTWDIKLATSPINLKISAGAYQGRFELGGLSLASLKVSDGAADTVLKFSQPNPIPMDELTYDTGASSVRLEGLANANFDTMKFKSGAGDYTLDFSGELQQDATVTIDSGVSSVTLIVPKGVDVRVLYDGGLSNVDISGAWEKSDGDYVMNGSGPRLTINVNLAAGSLKLEN